MTRTQRLFTRIIPGQAESIERESREWKAICQTCENTRSIWELGGIRWKAKSKGKRQSFFCPECGRRRVHRIERHKGDSAPS